MLAEFGVVQLAVWLMTVGVVAGIPVAVIALVFRLGQRSSPARPEEVLRARFARGEMTQAEFEAAMSALRR